MCGIVACFGNLDIGLLGEMLKSIRHRGPDDEGIFFEDNVALGVRRLAIVDMEHGRQPMHNEEKTVWIVFNGEIYNFPEIREELTKLGHVFCTETDTETVVHAYEEWSVDCLQRFNGMFAFAIWDKNKNRLFVARDRLGVKPLYYCSTSDRLVLASEIKALLVDSTVPRLPNESVIYDFLITGFQRRIGETFFSTIKELPPAHYMLLDRDNTILRKYWDLPAFELKQRKNDKYYASKFRELLIDAVRVRLPSHLRIGSYLSGGLDSTLVVCLANEILNSNLPSEKRDRNPQQLFCAFYSDAVADERPFMKEVSSFIKTKIDYVFPSNVLGWEDIKDFVYYMDEPVSVLNYYAYWCLARITSGRVRVTFSGQGPDEFLAGHPDHFWVYLKELWKSRRISRLMKESIAGLGRYGLLPVLRRSIMQFASRTMHVGKLLDPSFVSCNNTRKISRRDDSLHAALLLDTTENRLPMHLRVGDRVSSAFSIESRYPYLDHKVVESSFCLPSNQKIRNAWSKYVLRNAAKGLIPESVRKRKKLGTPVPIESWMKSLHTEISSVFGSSKFQQRRYFNQKAILDIYERYCEGKLSRLEKHCYVEVLWRILNVELWLEAFFDSLPSASSVLTNQDPKK
jgi:asparagine synthase (glutamine-hydrolysing)